MRKAIALASFLIVIQIQVIAQDIIDLAGPAGGLAGAVVCHDGGWMTFHNQAGLAKIEELDAGVFWENRFLSADLNNRGIYVAKSIGDSRTVGLSYRSFGYELYGDSKLGLAYAMAFGPNLTAGLQLNYYQLRFGDIYGKSGVVSFEGGAQFQASDNWRLGFHITNPLRVEWQEGSEIYLNQKIELGVQYLASDKVQITAQAEKLLREITNLRLGVDYSIIDRVALRAGYATYPSAMHLGIGLKFEAFRIDVASGWYQTLGFSPQIALSYAPKAKS